MRGRIARALTTALVLLGVTLTAGKQPARASQAGTVWPDENWATSTPEEQGFDSGALAEIITTARQDGIGIHSLQLVRHGRLFLDAYFYPYDGSTPHDTASVTKSVTTALAAIAIGEGKLGADQAAVSVFPDRPIANRDPRKEKLSILDLAGNTTGLDCSHALEDQQLAEMRSKQDWAQWVLDRPMSGEPGSAFAYCSPSMHLLSAVISRATGVSLLDYARTRLFAPLGIKNAFWPADPQGNNWGWGDLAIHPRDMARIGLLWLNHGLWNGRQVVPRDWVDASSKLRSRTGERYGEDYGLGWWISRSEPAYAAADGRGGQRIMAVPSLDLVIVTTGGSLYPGAVTDRLGGALRDAGKALPANPAGYARLKEALAAAKAPPAPSPVPAAPDAARAISGRTITFPDNPFTVKSIRLDFPRGGEARATLVAGGSTILNDAPVGLDGVYRLSPGLHDLPYGLRGRWLDEKTFLLDYNEIANLGEFLIKLTVTGSKALMEITEVGGSTATVEGQIGG